MYGNYLDDAAKIVQKNVKQTLNLNMLVLQQMKKTKS